MFTHLYRPREWPTLASLLNAAVNSDGTPIVEYFLEPIELDSSKPARTASAIDAVTCVDTPAFKNVDAGEGHQDAVEDLIAEMRIAQERTSRHFGALEIDLCHHWKVREAERYTGPFNSSIEGTVLVIGNTADVSSCLMRAGAIY
jgi:hypothetical protein